MNKIIKRTLIVLGAIAIIIFILMTGYLINFKIETGKMAAIETGMIADNIYAVKHEFVNFFIIKNNDTYIAIDAGANVKSAKNELKKLNISPDKIEAVFLTHTDSDHKGGLKLFTNADIYISTAEEQMINGKTARAIGFIRNSLSFDYKTIEDGQIFNMGGISVKGILTPGHTPGSMCYIVNDKYLFIGDSLSLKDGKAAVFNENFNMDSNMEITSWDKIKNLKSVEYIFTAHYGYTDDYKKAFD